MVTMSPNDKLPGRQPGLIQKDREIMRHVMFDVDGTLVKSSGFDADCYFGAVNEILDTNIGFENHPWVHVSDAGILNEIVASSGLKDERGDIQRRVKAAFIHKITDYVNHHVVQPVEGANEFVRALQAREDTVVSIATGGWRETAVLKLTAAGIDISGIPIASSNDHHVREEIMKTAALRATNGRPLPCYYFGDGAWDKRACEALGFNFVLVGDGIDYSRSIMNYVPLEKALECVGW